ncbi:hypothetical protein FOZ63_029594 [Perkinsus olseni]|uniref:Peptidase A1 domain-containing protein n=1 Tax=Perkinsus olseni TaxID=32597 RepID=A0A7J6QGQ8_PEROL|nr:hypothetical protein FOZ63_029594 [Perkinsus olseni]
MPVEDGFVTVEIDGQEVGLRLDSGYFGLAVMDGRWYKRKYGRDACKWRGSGCYFCPKKAPCKFKHAKDKIKDDFADNSSIKGLPRTGALVMDGHEPTDVNFMVSRHTVWTDNETTPWGFFGISCSPPGVTRQSLLDTLFRKNVVGRLSYTLRTNTSQDADFISGNLTLGETINESETSQYIYTKFVFSPSHHRALTAVFVYSLKLFDEAGNLRSKEGLTHRGPGSYLAIVDTGANALYLPQLNLVEDILKSLQVKLRQKGYSNEQISQMWRRDRNDFLHVKVEAASFLPVLGLAITEGPGALVVKIRPKHYCVKLVDGEVVVSVQYHAHAVLGTPFFEAYTVHVDYTDHKIALLEN